MTPFYAMIVPMGAIGDPPHASQGPGFPSNPIVVPPGGAWPLPPYATTGPGFPTNPINLPPGYPRPPYATTGPGFPTNPIVIPPGTPIPPDTPIIWPPHAHIENPITIVPPGKVMIFVQGGWVIVDQPEATPATPAKPK